MAANLDLLVKDFKDSLILLLDTCMQRGVEMRPFFTLRTPFEQAKLWRQSRSKEEINERIKWFKSKGADFLAYCLESVGPQNGPHVTNACPGYSWHQWGEAADMFWLVDGKAEWSTSRKIQGVNGYKVMVEEALKMELNPGGNWKSLKDYPHVQRPAVSSPSQVMNILYISQEMEKRFKGVNK